MTPERWQEVKKVLAGALERPPEERSVYLDQACAEPTLRREVESLIAAHEQGESSFMDRPVVESNEGLKSGTKLGPYEILARIGAGGMGVVYRARDGRLERDVAIKVLPSGLLTDDAARKRFRKEALALAKLNHPNIATVHDVGEQGGADYLVMECVLGQSLAEKLKSGSLTEREVVSLGAQIAAALEEAHDHHIVHRDLKPANIMVTPKGQAKVLDFGLARILRKAGDFAATESLTETQNRAGTLPYMAPEQLRGEPADARTDIHALGAVLFEIVTGKRLYQEDSVPQLTDAILHQQPVPPRALNARVSPEMERIVLKCLEKEPENRYQSAKELSVDLRRLGTPSVTRVMADARPASRRRLVPPLAWAAVAVVALGAGGYFHFHRAPKLTEKDSIVLADFTNTTGDPVFDGTLRQGLTAQLQQTPFLQIVSADRITQALRLMEKPANTRLTDDVAREICHRVNATALIQGSIAVLGSQYVLGLNALNCSTSDVLDQEQVTADGKERVLAALGTSASNLRKKLGESAASLHTYDAPFDQAITTSSLEALQAYTRGTDAVFKRDFPSGVAFFQRAVTLDPNFAMAYSVQGMTYALAGDGVLGAERITKAYSLRDRVSEREQFSIDANYASVISGDADQGVRIGEQWTKVFPRDAPAYIALYAANYEAGRFDQVLPAIQEVFRLDPTPFAYYEVARTEVMLGRLDDARAAIQLAEANHVDSSLFQNLSYFIAFLQGDSAEMDRVTATWVNSSPGEASMAQANTAAYHGQLTRSRQLIERAIASGKQQGGGQLATSYEVRGALTEALLGDFPEAEKAVKDAGKSPIDQGIESKMALAAALAGDIKQAQKLVDDLNRRYPKITYLRFGAVPSIQAIVALQQHRPDEAIKALGPVSSRELVPAGVTPQELPFMVPVYIRGQACLAAHQGADAAAQFQMILNHPAFVLNSITSALAHLGLGRAYALQGDTAKAKATYQDFLTLWKDADPDIPILKQAKAEYAKLH